MKKQNMAYSGNFAATLDGATRVRTTVGVLMLFAIGFFLSLLRAKVKHDSPALGNLLQFVSAMDVGVLVCLLLYAPKGYSMYLTGVAIRRARGQVMISYDDIEEVKIMSGSEVFGNSMRSFGSQGICGYFGTCKGSPLGNLSVYATRTSGDLVVLRLKSGMSVVLSPDKTQECMEVVENILAKNARQKKPLREDQEQLYTPRTAEQSEEDTPNKAEQSQESVPASQTLMQGQMLEIKYAQDQDAEVH